MAQKKQPSYREYEAELKRQISTGEFRPVYLICGEQDYLRHENMSLLQKAILGEGDAMNSTVLRGPEVRAADIIGIAQTMPFLAERRVITVTESEFFKKTGDEAEKLCEFLPQLPETTHLIFEEPSPNKTYKLYKAIAKQGYVLCCDLAGGDRVQPQDMQQLREWTAQLFAKDNLRISNRTVDVFLEYSGTDMLAIRSQEEKVSAYCLGKEEVLPEDIRAICVPIVKDRIFDMIQAIAEGKRETALAIYMDLTRLQTPPQVILSLMTRQYNQLLQIGELSGKMQDSEIASALKINPWALSSRLKPLLKGYTVSMLERLLELCMEADYEYKNGKITPELAVERLIIQCAGGKRGNAANRYSE